jgi:hypothetical protein
MKTGRRGFLKAVLGAAAIPGAALAKRPKKEPQKTEKPLWVYDPSTKSATIVGHFVRDSDVLF